MSSNIDKIRDDAKQAFSANDFYVSDFYFDHIIPEEGFRKAIVEDFSQSEIGQVLRFSPDFFVMSKKAKSSKGYLFVVVLDDRKSLDRDQKRILDKYYPSEKLVLITTEGSDMVFSWIKKWDRTDGSWKPLAALFAKIQEA